VGSADDGYGGVEPGAFRSRRIEDPVEELHSVQNLLGRVDRHGGGGNGLCQEGGEQEGRGRRLRGRRLLGRGGKASEALDEGVTGGEEGEGVGQVKKQNLWVLPHHFYHRQPLSSLRLFQLGQVAGEVGDLAGYDELGEVEAPAVVEVVSLAKASDQSRRLRVFEGLVALHYGKGRREAGEEPGGGEAVDGRGGVRGVCGGDCCGGERNF